MPAANLYAASLAPVYFIGISCISGCREDRAGGVVARRRPSAPAPPGANAGEGSEPMIDLCRDDALMFLLYGRCPSITAFNGAVPYKQLLCCWAF